MLKLQAVNRFLLTAKLLILLDFAYKYHMKINELLAAQPLEEGPKTRAAALAAMLGTTGTLGAIGAVDKYNQLKSTGQTVGTSQEIPMPTPRPKDIDSKDVIGDLIKAFPNTQANKEASPFLPGSHTKTLISVAKQMGLREKNDLANLLAQANVETADWQRATENFNYRSPDILHRTYTTNFPSVELAARYVDKGPVAIANRALANRNGNGNEATGDGWRYRGRGFLHITGKELYAKVGAGVHPQNPGIYVKNPELLSSNPTESAKASVWYYLNIVGKGKTADQASAKVNPAGLKKAERFAISQQMRDRLSNIKGGNI